MKNYFLPVLLFMAVNTTSYSQVFFLNFEGANPLTTLPSGVTNVNGTNTVRVKNTTNFAPIVNAVQTSGTNKELFLDFHGYLKLNLTSTTQFSLAYNYRRTDNNDDWWLGFLTMIGTTGTTNKLEQILIREWNGQLHAAGQNSSNAPIGFNTNYHIALTVSNGDIKVYVDGVERLNVPNSTSNYNIQTWTNASILMSFKGNSFDGTNVTPEGEFNANCRDARAFVDNVALFNTALNQTQVTSIFQNGNNSLSIDDQNQGSDVVAYPNPVANDLFFSSTEADAVDVYNMLGQKVMSKKVVNSTVNMNELSAGTYFITCFDVDGAKIKTIKVLKL